ncbi:MAG: hypothetical protein LBJ17_09515 [Dysgonamonadaceae bacterium]|jgi:hypothetical protein|nr:hypothetical protein [Dysgonamonadaceae bacterium]
MQKHLWTIVVIICCCTACGDDTEKYSHNPAHLLTFSTDTLSFDTLLTAVNSPVKAFRAYNRNSSPLLISSVSLEQGDNSPFKINVDGFAGKNITNTEIRAGDSIYIMVNIFPDDLGQTTPTRIRDNIVFITNGVSQKIVLDGWGQDVFHSREIIISTDSTLSAAKPYLVTDSIYVAEGATLTVTEGTVFYMRNNAQIIVNGTLKTQGTIDHPVTIRGSRTDHLPLSTPIPYDLIPNQWGDIRFGSNSFNNELTNTQIRNGNSGLIFDPSTPEQKKIILKNTRITNVSISLIEAVNCNISAENCEFSNSGNVCLNLTGGSYEFTHCTIANYYPSYREAGWKQSDNKTLYLSNHAADANTGATQNIPLLKADFRNTVFASLKTTGISINYTEETISPSFTSCLFTDRTDEDKYFTNCLFGVRQDHIFIDSRASDAYGENFAFDFSLLDDSPARNAADINTAQTVPFDLNGASRLQDGKPDIGAYEKLSE